MILKNKSKTLLLIAVRLKSKRLKNKALLPLQDNPLILTLHNRLKKVNNVSKIIWCTSTNKQDDPIYKLAKKNNIDCIRGSELNVISRFLKAINLYKARDIVRVTGDNPLTDPIIMQRMISIHKKNNYDYTYNDQLPNGTRSEIISKKALMFCLKNVNNPNNSEYMTWMLNRPDIYKVFNYKTQNKKIIFPNINFTVDNKKEYYNILRIFNNFKNTNFTLTDAIDFIKTNKNYKRSYILNNVKNYNNKNIDIKYKFEK